MSEHHTRLFQKGINLERIARKSENSIRQDNRQDNEGSAKG